MSTLTSWMDRTFYAAYVDSWDNRKFRETVLETINLQHRVLDLGAGRGCLATMNFRDNCTHYAGVDPDEAVFQNRFLHEAKILAPPEYKIPYEDNSFDIVVSNNVIEHVQDANFYFSEVNRVLRPGGHFFAKTPNKYHYVALFASCTPHWFHEFYNNFRGRETRDTFPTVYACNTRRAIRRQAENHGMITEQIEVLEGRPEYLRISLPTYLCGLAYERLVNMSSLFEPMRCVILMHLQKKETEELGSVKAA
ncbi:MAG: class I SAM-dependent methyltransferase [Planctomycetes bacterium]|nr:class I SAM-dependent methyltransferase [Planctomycetota bacterium]